MSKNPLETLFSSKLRLKILKFLFRHFGQSFNVKELSAHIQEKTNLVKKEIRKLIEIGLVSAKK